MVAICFLSSNYILRGGQKLIIRRWEKETRTLGINLKRIIKSLDWIINIINNRWIKRYERSYTNLTKNLLILGQQWNWVNKIFKFIHSEIG